MYREVWRLERDFLYDPHLHGLDLDATKKKYERYLPGIATRADLNYLFEDMLGELTLVNHFAHRIQKPVKSHPSKVRDCLTLCCRDRAWSALRDSSPAGVCAPR